MLQQLTFLTFLVCLSWSCTAEVQLYHHPLFRASMLTVHEPALTKLGDLVEHVPTAVSHQSSTIVHSSAPRVSPLLAPAVRSYSTAALELHPLTPAAAYVHQHAARAYPAWSYRSTPLLYATQFYRK